MSSALVTCPECGRPMKRKNLWSHLRVVHRRKEEDVSEIRAQLNKGAEAGSILCPLCNKCFPTHEVLALHCQENHSENGAAGRPQDYSRISRNFTSRDEYQRWLTEVCEETCTSFYKAHEEALTGSTRERLLCNRAGAHSSTATQRAATTRKDVRYCSCHLVVVFCENGTVTVRGCLGHVGHELEPALLRFSHKQIMYLKNLLEDDLPVETAVMASEEAMFCHPELDLEAPSTAEQERREARYNKLSSIKSVYAVVQASATSLAKTDTDEAMQQLEKILGYMELAAEVAQTSSSSALAVRPKLAGVGGKPQLTKVELYQRGKVRKPKKPVQDLHEEVRRLRTYRKNE